MIQTETDEMYMRRCLQLAKNGQLSARPNPMVGAVIVSEEGRIIGEGCHIRRGEGHAEVNAFASVRAEDEPLLAKATLYVSLEPCSHYGKTPPCADLIVRKGVRRVVCGCIDPFSEVQGRGIRRIRDAGIEVTTGVLEKECLDLNRKFITFHTHKRPYILLKWAQTVNGKIGNSTARPSQNGTSAQLRHTPLLISTPFTKMLVHKLRAENDAILVGRITEELEHPRLNVREWSGNSPQKFVLSSSLSFQNPAHVFPNIPSLLKHLYENEMQSLVVEGGRKLLQSFIDRGLWDEIRVETAPFVVEDGTDAPTLPKNLTITQVGNFGNTIITYRRKTSESE